MMKPSEIPKILSLIAVFGPLVPSACVLAQATEVEEEIKTISVDSHYPQEDPANTADEFEDLVFDEETQGYRLIETDEGEDWVEPPPQRETDTAEMNRLFQLYREALDNKAYLEADTLAKRVVELSIRIKGLDSHDSAKAITNLGIAQHHNKDYESARRNFVASIEIIERIDDRLSAELINPLRGLAATQATTGRPDLAKQSFQRAVHISHVNEGPHNSQQIQTLESMAELQISLGEFEAANSIQQNIYIIQSRNIGPKSMEIIPALENKARWQHRSQQYQGERVTWRHVINVIERHRGKESLELIPPLTSLGKSYLFVSQAEFNYQPDVSATSGETYLRRANRIAGKNPDANWETVEGTLLSLGDYYVLSGRPNRAARIYGEVWTLLSESEEPARLKIRREHMETVNLLQRVFPPRYYNRSLKDTGQPVPENFETGTMSFSFSVAPNGRVSGLRHIETQPREIEGFSETVGRSLRRLIYRPRSEDGELVATTDVIFTHEFFYRPSDIADKPAPPTPEIEQPAERTDEDAPPSG